MPSGYDEGWPILRHALRIVRQAYGIALARQSRGCRTSSRVILSADCWMKQKMPNNDSLTLPTMSPARRSILKLGCVNCTNRVQ